MSAPARTLEIALFANGKFLGSRQFTSSPITLGRGASCTLRLNDRAVSSSHAVITLTARSCVIEDVGSANGTFVAGQRIESHVIRPSDEVAIGPFLLRCVLRSAEDPADDDDDFEEKTSVEIIATAPRAAPPAAPPAAPQRPVANTTAPLYSIPAKPAPAPAPAEEDYGWLEELEPPTAQRGRPAAVGPAPSFTDLEPTSPGGEPTTPEPAVPEPAVPEPAELAPLPPVTYVDEDDEDDDTHFVPSFSLVQHLLEQDTAAAQAPDAVAELIVHRDDRVLDVVHLAPGRKVRFRDAGVVAAHRRGGGLVITFRGQAEGRLFTAQGERELDEVTKRSSKKTTVTLLPEHVASLEAGTLGTLHAHFVTAPTALPRQSGPLFPSRAGVISSATSFVVHVFVFVWLAFFQSVRDVDALPTEGRFAKINIKDLELEPPPPPPPPPPAPEEKAEETPPPPEPAPTPPRPEPAPRAKPRAKPTRVARASKSAGTPSGPPAPSKQAASLLSAINVSDASPSASATSVTNLDAVKVSRGTSAGFKTADTVAKLPGGRLALPGGVSDGRIDTKTGAELTKGNVGKVNAVEGKDGPVRGTVARAPAREVDVEGELDRNLVLKVVNEHMREVQGCYERKLVADRNLAGKIAFEWVITTSGTVSVVRVKFSSMRNTEVTTCIQSAIKSWSFPKPSGGNATIVYPFVFSTLGG